MPKMNLSHFEAALLFALFSSIVLGVITKRTDAERIRYGFRLCLGRSPTPVEEQRLTELLRQPLAELEQGAESGSAEREEKIPLDAWTTVARVLLNLDELITRE